MSIDYYSCKLCGNTFSDYDEDISDCDKCENWFCSYCTEKYKIEYNDETDELINCPICNKTVVIDEMIIEYVLKKYKVTKEQLMEEIKNE